MSKITWNYYIMIFNAYALIEQSHTILFNMTANHSHLSDLQTSYLLKNNIVSYFANIFPKSNHSYKHPHFIVVYIQYTILLGTC